MNVQKIRLIHFRNFLDLSLYFHPAIHVFIGNNAQGKTNIIESIYTLVRGSSYRTTDDQSLINWNQEKSYILGEVQKKAEILGINILFQRLEKNVPQSGLLKKTIKINKKNQNKTWLLKKFCPVIFTPEDLQIIKGSPSLRRKFLDEVIINIHPIYFQYLKDYYHILFQRNTLLKNGKNKNKIKQQLVLWDQKLVELGAFIIFYRVKVLQKLNQKAKIFHQMMTENKELVKLKYHSNILAAYSDDKEEIMNIMNTKLKDATEKDLDLRITTIGPHRDDYFIMSNEINLGIYGSQGQQRTTILSLKLAELELLKEKEDEYPLLLLDDVMSELDLERKSFLINLLKDTPIQTFITSISLDDILQINKTKNTKVFRVEDGRVKEE